MRNTGRMIWQLRIVIIIMLLTMACKKDNEVVVPPSIKLMSEQEGACFDITDSTIYFCSEASGDTSIQAGIDMIYYYSQEDENTMASPGANIEDGIFAVNPASWTIKNTSRYMKTAITPAEFLESMNDSIIIANYDEGEAKRKAKKLKQDDIYTFRAQNGKLGMFMVNGVNGTIEGSINISLKTQP